MSYAEGKNLAMIDKLFPDGGPMSASTAGWIGAGVAIVVVAAMTWCKLTKPDEFHSNNRRRK